MMGAHASGSNRLTPYEVWRRGEKVNEYKNLHDLTMSYFRYGFEEPGGDRLQLMVVARTTAGDPYIMAMLWDFVEHSIEQCDVCQAYVQGLFDGQVQLVWKDRESL